MPIPRSEAGYIAYVEMAKGQTVYRQRAATANLSKGHPSYSIAPSSASAILDQINRRLKQPQRATKIAILWTTIEMVLLAYFVLQFETFGASGNQLLLILPFGISFISWLIGLAFCLWSRRREQAAQTTTIYYNFVPETTQAYSLFRSTSSKLVNARRIWVGKNDSYHLSTAYRNSVSAGLLNTPFLNLNIDVFSLKIKDVQLLFLPDQVLIFQNNAYHLRSYRQINMSSRAFRAEGVQNLIPDAQVVEYRWLHS